MTSLFLSSLIAFFKIIASFSIVNFLQKVYLFDFYASVGWEGNMGYCMSIILFFIVLFLISKIISPITHNILSTKSHKMIDTYSQQLTQNKGNTYIETVGKLEKKGKLELFLMLIHFVNISVVPFLIVAFVSIDTKNGGDEPSFGIGIFIILLAYYIIYMGIVRKIQQFRFKQAYPNKEITKKSPPNR